MVGSLKTKVALLVALLACGCVERSATRELQDDIDSTHEFDWALAADAGDAAVPTIIPRHLAISEWQWPPPPPDKPGHTSTGVALAILESPGESDYYWAHQWGFTNGKVGYMGLQPNGVKKNNRIGKMAIFSVWDAESAYPEGNCERFGGEGNGWSCRISYPFVTGRNYALVAAKITCAGDPPSTQHCWRGAVADTITGETEWIGDIKVSGSWWIRRDVLTFTEYFGTVPLCTSFPSALVRWQGFSGTSYTTGVCASRAAAWCDGGSCYHDTRLPPAGPGLNAPSRLMVFPVYEVINPPLTAPAPVAMAPLMATTPAALAAGPGVAAAPGAPLKADLTWDDTSSTETNFEIERSEPGVSGFQNIGVTQPNRPSFRDTVPSPSSSTVSRTFGYRVRAVSGGQASAYSNTEFETFWTTPPDQAPVAFGPQACVNTARPTFSWGAVPRANSYYLKVTRADLEYFFVDRYDLDTTSFTLTSNLEPGVRYRWGIKACNNLGCGPWRELLYFTPFCAPTEAPALLAPAGCVATARPTLSWSPVQNAASYQVRLFRGDVLVGYPEVTATSWTVPTDLALGVEHRFGVKALNNGTMSPWSTHRYFTPGCAPNALPGTPGPLSPSTLVGTATPRFSFEVATQAAEYQVQVWSSTGSVLIQESAWYPASALCSGATCAYTQISALPNAGYAWRVRARNAQGVGPFSPWTTFSVNAVVAADDAFSVLRGASTALSYSSLLSNDLGPDLAIDPTAFGSPQHGTLTPAVDRVTFNASNPNYVGSDRFSYLVRGRGGQDSADVAATIYGFSDVTPQHWAQRWVDALFMAGVTTGCASAPPRYCPADVVARWAAPIFILRALNGGAYQPPACVTPPFLDVPCSNSAAPWIAALKARGLPLGCAGPSYYCPDAALRRSEAAVFLLLAREGLFYTPPACVQAPFSDVPCSYQYAAFVYEAWRRGMLSTCAPGRLCPDAAVTRDVMAAAVVEAFDFPLPQ